MDVLNFMNNRYIELASNANYYRYQVDVLSRDIIDKKNTIEALQTTVDAQHEQLSNAKMSNDALLQQLAQAQAQADRQRRNKNVAWVVGGIVCGFFAAIAISK